jgi:putative membrane protein
MYLTGRILAALVAAIHVYILYLEMFAWTTPRTRAAFGTSEQLARDTRVMAANQGLYNGFLAAGLVWGLSAPRDVGFPALAFFLACVAVAGVYGALSVSRRILYVQTVPALTALGLLLIGR